MNIQRNLEICLDELNSETATPQLIRRAEQIIDVAIAQKQELEDAISSTSQALSRAKRGDAKMTFNQEMYNSLIRHFLEKKMPWDIANAAAYVVASEQPKHQRTPNQQKAVDVAMAWMNSHPNSVNQ